MQDFKLLKEVSEESTNQKNYVEQPIIKNESSEVQTFLRYKDLANENNIEAFIILGDLHRFGIGTEVNLEEAYKCYRKAADVDHPDGLFILGKCYEEGWYKQVCKANALKYYQRSSMKGHTLAKIRLAIHYVEQKNFQEAVIIYEELVSKELDPQFKASCYFQLGYFYAHSLGVNQSNQRAKEYYKLASPLNGNACIQLGFAYQEGELGLKKSPKLAFKFYDKAYKLGTLSSAKYLGFCYEHGFGVEKSKDKANYYYRQLAKSKEIKPINEFA